jgi:O-methyltransferase
LPTCLNLRKLCVIASLLSQTNGGAVVECGAFMGGTTVLLGALLRQWADSRHVLAFDTFEGMPAPVAKDGETVYVAGLFTQTSYEHMVKLIADNDLTSRISIYKGLVQDNLPTALKTHGTISFALVDTDQYLGTIESLKQIVPRLATSGLIVVDDYGVSGVRLAVDEAKTLFPTLKGVLLSENFYVLWNKVDQHFLSNTDA